MTDKLLSYKGFDGTVEVDADLTVCIGKILFIDDLILYEADSPKEIEAAFRAAVDEYLATCKEIGKQPQKPCSGTFQVRTSPSKHRQVVVRSIKDGVSMNEVVSRAIDCYVSAPITSVQHNLTVKIEGDLSLIRAGSEQQWTNLGSTYVRH